MPTFRTYFYQVAALGTIARGIGAKGKPFASFPGTITTSGGTAKERTITLFNTKRDPELIETVIAILANGPARLVVTFDKAIVDGRRGETVRVVGLGMDRRAANDPTAAPLAA